MPTWEQNGSRLECRDCVWISDGYKLAIWGIFFFLSMAFCCSLTVVPSQTAAVVTLVLLPWISAKPFSSSYWCWHDSLKVFQSILRSLGSTGVCLKIIQKSPHLPAFRAWGWRRPFFGSPPSTDEREMLMWVKFVRVSGVLSPDSSVGGLTALFEQLHFVSQV